MNLGVVSCSVVNHVMDGIIQTVLMLWLLMIWKKNENDFKCDWCGPYRAFISKLQRKEGTSPGGLKHCLVWLIMTILRLLNIQIKMVSVKRKMIKWCCFEFPGTWSSLENQVIRNKIMLDHVNHFGETWCENPRKLDAAFRELSVDAFCLAASRLWVAAGYFSDQEPSCMMIENFSFEPELGQELIQIGSFLCLFWIRLMMQQMNTDLLL